MRSEQEMHELIASIARNDERIRAAIMNGSRADPNAPRDLFQDDVLTFTLNKRFVLRRYPSIAPAGALQRFVNPRKVKRL